MSQRLADALLKRISYLSAGAQSKIKSAIQFASNAHEGQIRLSGAPQLNHALEVGLYIAELRLDSDTVIASILHDMLKILRHHQRYKNRFGATVAKCRRSNQARFYKD